MKQQVYELVMKIPSGYVMTYGQIAEQLGNRKLARAVGNVLHGNPDPTRIPCHRVVNGRGMVSDSFAFGGAAVQRQLLEREGIVFEENGRIDLRKYGLKIEVSSV